MASLEPADLVREACQALEDEVKGRRVTLDVDLPASLPRVLGHGDALVQVLVNLLKNALDAVSLPKEGRSGPGLVRIAVTAAGGSVLFTVDDDGPGLAREEQEKVFAPFHTTKGRQGGVGLGLAIAGDIIRAHGGSFSVDSIPGTGRPVHGESPRSDMKVLIVDDEPVVREVLRTVLSRAGYATSEAATAGEGLALFADPAVDLVLLDLMLPDRPGLSLLAEMRQKRPDVPVVVVTAYSSVESAITAMKEGAFHYVPKPFRNEEVVHLVAQALERRRLVAENRSLKARLGAENDFPEMVGRSAPMEKVLQTIRQAAPARSTILVTGESGTGKELVARALHRLSLRASGPFVTVHSGAMPPDLLESNLFGHTKGAFTGAVAEKKGLFKVADGGTIFFDEIGTVPLETQAKLLRVLQEREFLPVGAVEPIHSDVRVVAATNADLGRLVEEGKFREDLFYRLCVITDRPPAPAGAQGGHPAPRRRARLARGAGERAARPSRDPRGDEGAPRPRLARQRPGAGERPRARRRPRPGPRRPRPAPRRGPPLGPAPRGPPGGGPRLLRGGGEVREEPPRRGDAPRGRGAEGRRAPPRPLPDDAQRDAQAPRHDPAPLAPHGRRAEPA